MKKELLAPAGDIEAGYAALYYGADAVYLGLQKFSARATATNFDEDNLNQFVGYAHSLGRKVYAAINTVVQERELSDLLLTLDICSRCHIDAVILQDLGVARIIREQYPELELHASTQMAVHNKEGALALQKMGFSRVVIARELSLREIKEIAAIPGLETEAFIHGALCFSYSGLCMFSSFESGRSANRGKCLYPCRANFDGESGEKHYFSMKDMAMQEEILKMPVTSLKIEGRKKSALYVAAVTDYYRNILDGNGANINKEENIKQIFSRPWTKFHLKGKNKDVIDRDFVGHRGLLIGKVEQIQKSKIIFKTHHEIARYDGIQIDIVGQEKPFGFSVQSLRVNGKNVFEAKADEIVEVMLPPLGATKIQKGQAIYLASSSKVKGTYDYKKPKPNEYRQRLGLDIKVVIEKGRVEAICGEYRAEICGEFSPAMNVNKTAQAVCNAFSKTGDTDFELDNLEVENKSDLFVPLSLLNELRRNLYAQIEVEHKYGKLETVSEKICHSQSQWVVKTDDVSCLAKLDINDLAEVIVLLKPEMKIDSLKGLPKNKIRLALPAVCRNPDNYMQLIKSLLGAGYKKWEIANYWGLSVLPEKGIDLSFDSSLYVLNSQAMLMAKELGVSKVAFSVEDTMSNLLTLNEKAVLPTSLVVYQDVSLFISANCIRNNTCAQCSHEDKWINLRKDGVKYQALSSNCQLMMFADKAYCISDVANKINADFYRADFCYKKYSADKVAEIMQKLMKFETISNTQSANVERNVDLF